MSSAIGAWRSSWRSFRVLIKHDDGGEKMHYDTALRAYTSKRVEEIESADILMGNR
jgi:hypothetical protein